MSLFQRSFYGPDPSFTPLFRLLDDFDTYSREVQGHQEDGGSGRAVTAGHSGTKLGRGRFFNPKFDVRETEAAYELHGEFPGIERDNITIEFTEPQTMVIRGRVERTYQSGTPPVGLVTGGTNDKRGALTTGKNVDQAHAEGGAVRKVTVEDETDAATGQKDKSSSHKDNGDKLAEVKQRQQSADKLWVSERSVGEFMRTFAFPNRVDPVNVLARLQNGILNVTVPKAKKAETHRININ